MEINHKNLETINSQTNKLCYLYLKEEHHKEVNILNKE